MMTFGEFKRLNYSDDLPMEYALVQSLLDKNINILEVNNAYSLALEKESHIKRMKFEEACINLTQLLCGNYKGKNLLEVQQRAIHTLNMSETLPHNLYNSKYEYTDEVKEYWDNHYESTYGVKLNKE